MGILVILATLATSCGVAADVFLSAHKIIAFMNEGFGSAFLTFSLVVLWAVADIYSLVSGYLMYTDF